MTSRLPPTPPPGRRPQRRGLDLRGGQLLRPQGRLVRSFRALAREEVLFTPALLYGPGRFDRDLIQEFVNEARGEPRIRILSGDSPYIVGEGVELTLWGHTFLWVERARWQELRNFFLNVGCLDIKGGRFWKLYLKQVLVPDWAALSEVEQLPSRLPLVELQVFCVAAVDGCYEVEDAVPSGKPEPLRVVKKPADPELVKFAEALLSESDDPHAAVEKKPAPGPGE